VSCCCSCEIALLGPDGLCGWVVVVVVDGPTAAAAGCDAVEEGGDPELDELSWLASSFARVSWSEANVACADVAADWSGVTSREARVCPAVTCWPTETFTVLTVPDTLKPKLASFTGVIVPTESRVLTAVPVLTSAVR
jgi:hypothetical protein